MAADNIVGWETIMANGSIVNVDAATHPDLAQAMRGSGSQFGIVTKYTVRTHPIGKVWGGLCAYADTQSDDLYAALHNFVADGARDPKAAIIFTDIVLTLGVRTKLIFSFYDGPTPPTSGPFADFFKIPAIECLPRTQKYTELVCLFPIPHLESSHQYSYTSALCQRRTNKRTPLTHLVPRKSLLLTYSPPTHPLTVPRPTPSLTYPPARKCTKKYTPNLPP